MGVSYDKNIANFEVFLKLSINLLFLKSVLLLLVGWDLLKSIREKELSRNFPTTITVGKKQKNNAIRNCRICSRGAIKLHPFGTSAK